MNSKTIISFFTRRRIIYIIIAVVALGGGWYFFAGNKKTQETLTVHPGNFLQQVSVSGKVTATESLDLSFEQTGITRKVNVSVGDSVKAGKLLVSQDVAQLSTQLAQMQAGIDLQKAKLDQLLAGSSPEDIKIKEAGVAASQQNLDNAYQSAVVVLNQAYNAAYSANVVALNIQNTYFSDSDQAGLKVRSARSTIDGMVSDIKMYSDNAKNASNNTDIDVDITHIISDLNQVYANVSIIRDQCDTGVYYLRVSSTDKTSLDTQKTSINTQSTSVSSSQQSIASYKIALDEAQGQLDLVKAAARPTDVAVFEAQIKQAQASADDVLTQIRKREIFSPIDGIVTQVNAKVGSLLSPSDVAVSVISNGKFQIESYVPEIYVSLLKVGDEADVTLDAYGTDKIFKAKLISIDPAQTIKDGVSTYKVKMEMDDTQEQIKVGMSANVIITTEQKDNVISIPQGVVISKDGKKFVMVKQGDSAFEREVQIGDVSSSGQVEITSGLKDGDVVIIK